MNCADCGHALSDRSAFCCHCGARVGAGPATAPGRREPDAQTLLSRANLLRVRGQWEAAAEHCAAVLKIQPQNPAAHSLLGEIYDNQGHLERAIRWYEEALELNPGSVADRAKLARARELLQSRQASATRDPRATFSWLRVAGLAGAVICGGIILLAVIFAREQPSATSRAPDPPVFRRPMGRAAAPLRSLTTRERQMGARVASDVRPPLKFAGFQLDPRDRSVQVALMLDAQNLWVPGIRRRLMLDGYRVAHRVAQEYPEVPRVELRIVGRVPDASGAAGFDEYLFIGSMLSGSLTARPEIVAATDLPRIYERSWWGPRVPL